MITPDYARTMARYNAWQNHWVFAAADRLGEEARQADRGTFFGSIHATLCHLAWGDALWISRFDGGSAPNALPPAGMAAMDWGALYSWPDLMAERPRLDARIAAWAWGADASDFSGDLDWFSDSMQCQMSRPRAICALQMFNHQTHHRGQVHAMLTAAGALTETTDLPFMPEEVPEWR